jgi:hypothetical protein
MKIEGRIANLEATVARLLTAVGQLTEMLDDMKTDELMMRAPNAYMRETDGDGRPLR